MLTDFSLATINAEIDQNRIAPSNLPDLFAGRAATCFFRFSESDDLKKLMAESDGKGRSKKASKTEIAINVMGKESNGRAYNQQVKAKLVSHKSIASLSAKSTHFGSGRSL